ncbi:hypothetical protein COOONC_19627 [Cooperia oncophora]
MLVKVGIIDSGSWMCRRAVKSEALGSFEQLFRRALQCLPSEDIEAQRRFRFRDDSLSCIIGRLLVRQAVHKVCGTPWHAIKIGRAKQGKPYLLNSDARLNFNVSHQGDFVALATSLDEELGGHSPGHIIVADSTKD